MQAALQTAVQAPALTAEHTGTLLHPAQARTAMLDSAGHAVPVLCLDIALDNAVSTRMHVEQAFPSGQHKACEAAAHRLKKGMRVTVQGPLTGITLVALDITHIQAHQGSAR